MWSKMPESTQVPYFVQRLVSKFRRNFFQEKSFPNLGDNLIALQALDTDDLEACEYSSKFRAEIVGDMEKLMACVGH